VSCTEAALPGARRANQGTQEGGRVRSDRFDETVPETGGRPGDRGGPVKAGDFGHAAKSATSGTWTSGIIRAAGTRGVQRVLGTAGAGVIQRILGASRALVAGTGLADVGVWLSRGALLIRAACTCMGHVAVRVTARRLGLTPGRTEARNRRRIGQAICGHAEVSYQTPPCALQGRCPPPARPNKKEEGIISTHSSFLYRKGGYYFVPTLLTM
jgi:hypothetical protein